LNKIKEFLSKMTKQQKIIAAVVAVVVVIALIAGIVVMLSGNSDSEKDGGIKTYKIEVKSEGGKAFEDLEVHIYEDSTMTELLNVGKTDENGVYSFEANSSDKYVAVLKKVPAGYVTEEYYAIKGETLSVSLKAKLLSAEDVTSLKLGAVAVDMTITTADGSTYTISELLKEKKAVVLNFWFEGCDPCRAEFPYLEEAYKQYSDKLEVLAVNTYDGDESSVAAYKTEMGLTFPMAKADVKFATAYNVLAYPTTIVIDRYGTVGFLHTGSVPDTDSFTRLFDYFTSDNYVQSTVRNLDDLVEKVEGGDGTKENPFEKYETEFEVEVSAGTETYYQIYKVSGMSFEITDADAYVVIDDKKYEAKDGKVSLVATTADTYTPFVFAVGSISGETKKFNVKFSFIPGTLGAPFTMNLGDFNVNVSAGNEQGVYYTYTATENGTLTLNCTGVTPDVDYEVSLYNTVASILRNLSSDGDSATSVSVPVNAGDEVQISIGTLPNQDNEYPAADFTFNASFVPGEGTGIDSNAMVNYKVTVVDKKGNGISGVTVTLNDAVLTTDANGVVTSSIIGGNYIAKVTAPNGYKEDTTEYIMTKYDNELTVTLEKTNVITKTYTVKVTDESGKALKNAGVTVDGNYVKTDSNGKATFTLEEGDYTVNVSMSGYATDGKTYKFSNGVTELTVTMKKEASASNQVEYKVTVVTYNNKAIKGVKVQFKNGDTVVDEVEVNSNGVATVTLKSGTYTAVVSDDEYGSGTISLTAKKSSASLIAAKKMDTSKGVEEYFGTTYPISEGAVYVTLNKSADNYFVFAPTKAGKYEIKTTSSDAKLAPCGSSAFVYTPTYEGNTYTTEIKSGMVGSDIAVSVTGTTGAVIIVTRTGNAEETIYRDYEGKKSPTSFTLTSGGNNLTYVDVTASSFKIVLGSDGYYHKDTATGPIVYVNLGPKAPYLQLQIMIQGSGQAGGAPLVSYTTENGQQVRIDYSNFLIEHFECMDQTYGIYPLTEDLKYVLQTAGEYIGWWDSTNANNAYLFGSVSRLNKDIAWMFACCYVK